MAHVSLPGGRTLRLRGFPKTKLARRSRRAASASLALFSPPLTSASEGILRVPCAASAVGVNRTGDGFVDLYAPFGAGDLWDMVARPNRSLPLAKFFAEKTARWQLAWPQLTVYPWVEAEE